MDPVLKIGFVGAGAINFGRPHLPWDHASRLEQIGGVQVIAICDPDIPRAEGELNKRLSSAEFGHMYKDCKILKEATDLIALKPDAVFIGIPPAYRGSFNENRDIELQFVKAGINVFVEKPLSVVPPEDFGPYVDAVTNACNENSVVLSVGYMFRYHAAINKMKELIQEHGGKVMAFNARYYFAYTEAINKFWFHTEFSGGPIVEQATHFCDLARFLVNDVNMKSLQCTVLKDSDESGAGHLTYVPNHFEADISIEKRIPRVTLAQWRFKDSGLGTLTHSVALPGSRYEANIDVQLDGLKLSLIEPYQKSCILRVRSMSSGTPNEDKDYTFEDDDCYKEELETFIKAVRAKDQSLIQSSYADAAKTYDFTWAIRRLGDKS